MTTEDKTLLDAPTDTKTGADDAKDTNKDGSLLDDGKANDAPKVGTDGKPLPPPDKTPPADPLKDGKDPKTDDKVTLAPEKYADPKLPEGMELDKDALEKFNVEAKSLNLSQEQYQKLIDIQTELSQVQQKKIMDHFAKQIADERKESIDKLGSDYEKELALAVKAIDRALQSFPEMKERLKERLNVTGMGNFLPLIQVLTFFGKTISEDKFIDGKPDTKNEKSVAERIYPNLAPK
jgi:hypothetical protein